MTGATPVDRVVAMLRAAHYRSIETPLPVAGLTFDFPAVLIGPPRSPDLIVLADAALDSEDRIVQRVEGLARALDVMQSKRPMTLVVTGPRLSSTAIDTLGRVARILGAGDAADAGALKNALAVLLPLDLPEAAEDVDAGRLPASEIDDKVVEVLLGAAARGERAVKDQLFALIEEPFDAEYAADQQAEDKTP
jgi:hypothetical protein